MAGTISIGGLISGLDTNSIIDQLVALERRPIELLSQQVSTTQATRSSLDVLQGKFLALKNAVDGFKTTGGVLVRKAASSATSVLDAAAGSGAERGSATITVTQLARGSVAGATVGRTTASDTVAAGDGTFRFQVGSGDVQTVQVSATTTLQELANEINATNSGVRATAINVGTSSSPDYRLQLQTTTTGSASTLTIVQDDTQLAIQTAQTGQDAQFTVSGFSTSFTRESNSFADVLPGVTITLKSLGTSTLTVDDDVDAITDKVKGIVAAYNDIQTYVAGESTIEAGQDEEELATGALANNSTVRQLVGRLQELFSAPAAGATTQYVNLSSLGLATQKDGTILFNEGTFKAALADDATAVAELFAGNGTATGVANDLSSLIAQATGPNGAFANQTSALDQQIRTLQDSIEQGERNVDATALSLRQQFANLEQLVSSLQNQGNYLISALTRSS